MRVPEGAGEGQASVRLSFADWKAGEVAPSVGSIALVNPKPKQEATAATQTRPQPKVQDSPELRCTMTHTKYFGGLACSPDGKLLATGMMSYGPDRKIPAPKDHQGVIVLWDAATGKEVATLKSHHGSVGSLAFTPDGKRLVSSSWLRNHGTEEIKTNGLRSLKGELKVWDVASGKEVASRSYPDADCHQVNLLDDTTVTFTIDRSGTKSKQPGDVRLWNFAKDTERVLLTADVEMAFIMSASQDRKHLLVLDTCFPPSNRLRDSVKLLTIDSGEARPLLECWLHDVSAGCFAPDGKTVALVKRRDIQLLDVATGKEIGTLHQTGRPSTVTYSPDGRWLAVGVGVFDKESRTDVGEIILYDLASRQPVGKLLGHQHSVSRLVFSPDGQSLASTDYYSVKTWDLSKMALAGEGK